MALCAGDGYVLAGERELGGLMIELRALPLRGVVAEDAVLREARRNVVGRLGGLVVLQVAGFARCIQARILSRRVALRAVDRSMFARQRELSQIMIELRALPLHCGVAHLAVLRKARRNVIGILGCLIILQMAGITIG